jgi:iron complex transport system permease protein
MADVSMTEGAPSAVRPPLEQQENVTRLPLWISALGFLLLVSVTLGVSLGPVPIPFGDVWRVAAYKVGFIPDGDWSNATENIVWLIRFPRVLLAVFVGGGLAVVGVTMQALVRNPLADSYILGISSGASVGAVLAFAVGAFAFAGTFAVSVGAFSGALVALVLVYVFALSHGRITPTRLILAGLGIGYVFSGITSFITMTSDNRYLAGQVLSWTLGSLARAGWADLSLPALVVGVLSSYLVVQARAMNALLMGDETAATLGINLHQFRRLLFVLVSLLTGILVAVSGSIGFIGLMIPHMVRFAVRSDHRRVLPLSLLIGAIFLIWVDVLARTLIQPAELPVGVITALIGGPFFLYLLWRSRNEKRGGME